jgi:hypothetical protein
MVYPAISALLVTIIAFVLAVSAYHLVENPSSLLAIDLPRLSAGKEASLG